MRDFVLVFSDQTGIDQADRDEVAGLAKAGALVAEIDSAQYLKRLDADTESCHDLTRDIEAVSREVQKAGPSNSYHLPILAGKGLGGALAEAALAQAPEGMFAGAASVDPAGAIPTKAPLCHDALGLHAKLGGFWSAGFTSAGTARDRVAALKEQGSPVTIADTNATFNYLVQPHMGDPPDPRGFVDLPTFEVDPEQPSDVMALLVTGEDGWRELPPDLANSLSQAGVSVLGFDSLSYFWREKTPHLASEDMGALIQFFMRRLNTNRVMLIGDSFGADLLFFVFNRLPPDLQGHVVQISLINYFGKADFEITPNGWLGAPPTDKALPAAPEMARLPAGILQCFGSTAETEAACEGLPKGSEIINSAGADHAKLAEEILEGMKKRLGR